MDQSIDILNTKVSLTIKKIFVKRGYPPSADLSPIATLIHR
jgi:hypothetical protein